MIPEIEVNGSKYTISTNTLSDAMGRLNDKLEGREVTYYKTQPRIYLGMKGAKVWVNLEPLRV
jgi:hypothetical protein